ncbi:hypothetical protein PR048_018177 [Dryococelus australis]|uniref:Uncharacterized protein n=1 Tax=Dryococelus australis TaxID=614101 RepID=A0ABQ9HBX8_9NEOP|nr:hypothetical protein PR048_018177 [Dryococelus australis]
MMKRNDEFGRLCRDLESRRGPDTLYLALQLWSPGKLFLLRPAAVGHSTSIIPNCYPTDRQQFGIFPPVSFLGHRCIGRRIVLAGYATSGQLPGEMNGEARSNSSRTLPGDELTCFDTIDCSILMPTVLPKVTVRREDMLSSLNGAATNQLHCHQIEGEQIHASYSSPTLGYCSDSANETRLERSPNTCTALKDRYCYQKPVVAIWAFWHNRDQEVALWLQGFGRHLGFLDFPLPIWSRSHHSWMLGASAAILILELANRGAELKIPFGTVQDRTSGPWVTRLTPYITRLATSLGFVLPYVANDGTKWTRWGWSRCDRTSTQLSEIVRSQESDTRGVEGCNYAQPTYMFMAGYVRTTLHTPPTSPMLRAPSAIPHCVLANDMLMKHVAVWATMWINTARHIQVLVVIQQGELTERLCCGTDPQLHSTEQLSHEGTLLSGSPEARLRELRVKSGGCGRDAGSGRGSRYGESRLRICFYLQRRRRRLRDDECRVGGRGFHWIFRWGALIFILGPAWNDISPLGQSPVTSPQVCSLLAILLRETADWTWRDRRKCVVECALEVRNNQSPLSRRAWRQYSGGAEIRAALWRCLVPRWTPHCERSLQPAAFYRSDDVSSGHLHTACRLGDVLNSVASLAAGTSLPPHGSRCCSGLTARLPRRRTGFDFQRCSPRIFARGKSAGRYRWSAGFLGDLPLPLLFHSGTAVYSPQLHSSALKTSLLRAAQICSLAHKPLPGASKRHLLRTVADGKTGRQLCVLPVKIMGNLILIVVPPFVCLRTAVNLDTCASVDISCLWAASCHP